MPSFSSLILTITSLSVGTYIYISTYVRQELCLIHTYIRTHIYLKNMPSFSSLILTITSLSVGTYAMRMPLWVNESSICSNGNLCEKPNADYEWYVLRFQISSTFQKSLSLSLSLYMRIIQILNRYVYKFSKSLSLSLYV